VVLPALLGRGQDHQGAALGDISAKLPHPCAALSTTCRIFGARPSSLKCDPVLRTQAGFAPGRSAVEPASYARIRQNPKFAELVQQRNVLARTLTVAMLVIYFGFILLVAFAPGLLAVKIGAVTTIGIPLGLLVIVSAFVLTGIYVAKANTSFDRLNDELLREVK
jgi:uncharacterized membrane protein (DUF485 family)